MTHDQENPVIYAFSCIKLLHKKAFSITRQLQDQLEKVHLKILEVTVEVLIAGLGILLATLLAELACLSLSFI